MDQNDQNNEAGKGLGGSRSLMPMSTDSEAYIERARKKNHSERLRFDFRILLIIGFLVFFGGLGYAYYLFPHGTNITVLTTTGDAGENWVSSGNGKNEWYALYSYSYQDTKYTVQSRKQNQRSTDLKVFVNADRPEEACLVEDALISLVPIGMGILILFVAWWNRKEYLRLESELNKSQNSASEQKCI